MADSRTVTQLIASVRQRANMENSTFCSDSEIIGYIDNSYKAMNDLIIDAAEDYNVTSESFTLTTSNLHAKPTDFYKLRGLDDVTDSTRPRTVRKWLWNERNDWAFGTKPFGDGRYSDVMYRLVGSNIQIMPSEKAAKPYILYYVPITPALTAGGDTAYGINGWLEYVILDAAIKCLVKEESDIKELLKLKNEIIGNIERMKKPQDQGLPERISRVRTRRDWGGYVDPSERIE